MSSPAEVISAGSASLGIELGSTRIKACLVGENPGDILAVGSFEWENRLADGFWTYSLDSVWEGLASAVAEVKSNVASVYGVDLASIRAIGVSAMMHGYLAFDHQDELLVPFRTWRNTNTSSAAAELTLLFGVNIPLRWSIAHLHQAVLENAEHVPDIRFVTTLAGYVHWKLTGHKILGIGDASGMFPIDSTTRDYDHKMVRAYDQLAELTALSQSIRRILPEVRTAGEVAGVLTEGGALLLDPTGGLKAGALACPPEGDAGTGMVATNAVAPRTGNVSVGTSIFAMVVLEKPLVEVHQELDIVTTPSGNPVAMVHCNNGASELAAWVGMFRRFAEISRSSFDSDQVYELLFREALEGADDAGGLLAYNYLAGEPIAGVDEGRPLFVRTPDSSFTLSNVMRAQIYGVFGTLIIGMQVLEAEGVELDSMSAHGGMFRTEGVAQRFLAAALDVPVSLSSSASEGGAWGAAVLAVFTAAQAPDLTEYLNDYAFQSSQVTVTKPDPADVSGFARYFQHYRAGLPIALAAGVALPTGE
jgi:sugar (pentulose or hexulose) kinase